MTRCTYGYGSRWWRVCFLNGYRHRRGGGIFGSDPAPGSSIFGSSASISGLSNTSMNMSTYFNYIFIKGCYQILLSLLLGLFFVHPDSRLIYLHCIYWIGMSSGACMWCQSLKLRPRRMQPSHVMAFFSLILSYSLWNSIWRYGYTQIPLWNLQ